MTVIAYRDGIMAADSHVSDNERLIGKVQKLSRAPDGSIGGASGRDSACQRFHLWVEGGMAGDFDPKCDPGYFGGFVVSPDGRVKRMDNTGFLGFYDAPFFAEGCGHCLAIGAMAMGATAEQAVQVAIDWDNGCGGAVQVVRLHEAETQAAVYSWEATQATGPIVERDQEEWFVYWRTKPTGSEFWGPFSAEEKARAFAEDWKRNPNTMPPLRVWLQGVDVTEKWRAMNYVFLAGGGFSGRWVEEAIPEDVVDRLAVRADA